MCIEDVSLLCKFVDVHSSDTSVNSVSEGVFHKQESDHVVQVVMLLLAVPAEYLTGSSASAASALAHCSTPSLPTLLRT
jgi:hypothetical protein